MIFNKLSERLFAALAGVLSMLFVSAADAEYVLNMTRGVTPISRDLYSLHMIVLWVCVVIAIVVFGVMIWSIIYHRKSRGAVAANFHENAQVEVFWTVGPLVILIAIAIPAMMSCRITCALIQATYLASKRSLRPCSIL